jgi:hypothetical protein
LVVVDIVTSPSKASREVRYPPTQGQSTHSDTSTSATNDTQVHRVQLVVNLRPHETRSNRDLGSIGRDCESFQASQVYGNTSVDIGRTDKRTMSAAFNRKLALLYLEHLQRD